MTPIASTNRRFSGCTGRRPPVWVVAWILLPMLVPGLPAGAQDEGEASGSLDPWERLEVFSEEIAVEVVEVEVRVTDRKGRPITGLTRDEFRLFVDGVPVEVQYFEEVRETDAAGEPTRPAEPSEPGPGPGPVEPSGATERARPPEQSVVIFLDQVHLTTTGRKQLVRDMDRFLRESLSPEIPVMVASSAGGLHVVQDFTRDRQTVLDALRTEERARPGGAHEELAHASAMREIRSIYRANDDCPLGHPCDCALSQMIATVRNEAGQVEARVEDTLSALDTLSAALRGLPGEKTVLLATDGLEFRSGLSFYQYLMDICPRHDHQREIQRALLDHNDLLPRYQDLTAHAAANRVTVYTLETAGLQAPIDLSTTRSLRPSQRTLQTRVRNMQHTLFLLADETGGEAVLNANRYEEELDEISRDVETYYSLGFTPDHQGRDRVHRLRVAVEGDHHDVRHRKVFRHASPDGRIAERMLGVLLFGAEQNPLGVQLAVGGAEGREEERRPDLEIPAEDAPEGSRSALEVPVRVRVPLRGLTLSPGADDAVGMVRLFLSVQRADGEWQPVRHQRVPVRLRPGEDRDAAAHFVEVELDLEPGEYLLALGVRDELGGGTSYLRKTFAVDGRI